MIKKQKCRVMAVPHENTNFICTMSIEYLSMLTKCFESKIGLKKMRIYLTKKEVTETEN